MNNLKNHALSKDTPQKLMFASGVYYANLKWNEGAWTGAPIGATSGGGKVIITPEYISPELDGATVAIKGTKQLVSMTGSMETTLTEFKENIFKDTLHLAEDTNTTIEGYTVLKPKENIEDSDYLENIAFVGRLTNGKRVIVIMENALCTSPLEIEAKDKTQATYSCAFECHADIEQDDLTTLPIKLLFPKETETVPTV